MSRSATITAWIAALIAAALLGQTLLFKFTGAPEAVHIFSTLGVEPWGRYAAGVAELVTVILMLIPATAAVGALLGLGTMAGALAAHFGPLGFLDTDGTPTLFVLAIVVTLACATVLWLRRGQLPVIGARIAPAAA